MKNTPFFVAIAAIALAGAAWLYQRQLVATERTAFAAQQAQALRLGQQLAAIERQQATAREEVASLAQELQRKADAAAAYRAANPDRETQADLWRSKVVRLRGLFESQPDQKIPELQLLTDLDWLELARKGRPDEDERIARSRVRGAAIAKFMSSLRPLLREYRANAGGAALNDVTQLAPLFKPAMDPAILARYEIVAEGAAGTRRRNVVERAPIDEDFDARRTMAADGSGEGSGLWIMRQVNKAMEEGRNAYAAANNGRPPRTPSDVVPLISDPLGRAYFEAELAYQKDHNGQVPEDPAGLLPYTTDPAARAFMERLSRSLTVQRAANAP